ncbi:MAG: glycosyltransferase [Candidatus Dormibacteria bacterium]
MARDATAPLLTVVVPTRNEADNVDALVQRLATVLAGVPTQVLFIDDSTDDTPGVLGRLAAAPPEGISIDVVHRPPERQTGLGSAAAEGLAAASGELVAVMDGDLQHPPELLPRMIRALEGDDLDVVVASRYTAGGSARGLNGPARVLVSWASKVVAQGLFREARKTSDPLSGYFLCRRAAIDGLEFRPIGFKILLEVLVCVAGARVGDLPLTFAARHAGRSNASMAQGVAFIRHLRSLLVHVPGSARVWKYATVGAIGLLIYLSVLALLSGLGLAPHVAWLVSFGITLALNWQLNRVVTFADVASPFTAGRRQLYLPVAIAGGVANLVVFTLFQARLGVVIAGLLGALVAMATNYSVQRGLLRRPPRVAAAPGAQRHPLAGVVESLVSANVAYIPPPLDGVALDTAALGGGARAPRELLRAAETHKALLLAEAPSAKPQARSDVGVSAWMAVPVLDGGRLTGLLVLHREGQSFTGDELDTVLRALQTRVAASSPRISPLLAAERRGSG